MAAQRTESEKALSTCMEGGCAWAGGKGGGRPYALSPSLSYGTLSNSESRFPGARDLRLMVQRGQLHTSAAPSIQKRGRGQLRSRLNQPIEPPRLPPSISETGTSHPSSAGAPRRRGRNPAPPSRPSRPLLRAPGSSAPGRPDSAPGPPPPALPGAVARGGRAHWRWRARGPGPASLIGQRVSAEPRSPASRWGKRGRDRAPPERRARIAQLGARRIGVCTLEQRPGGKDLAPGRVRRALAR